MDIKGFKSSDGTIHKYDYGALANVPQSEETPAAGADGGYYTPVVTQPDDNTLQFDFTPSDPKMPSIEPVRVTLPEQDSGGNADLTTELKTALINYYTHVMPNFDDTNGLSYINAILTALGAETREESGGEDTPVEPDEPENPEVTLSSISVTYSGGDVAVGTAVSALTGIVVTAYYSDGTSETVTGYTLSGTIGEGSNTVTVSYGGKTTTFVVTGVAEESGGDEVEGVAVEMKDLKNPTTLTMVGYTDDGTTALGENIPAGDVAVSVEPFMEDTKVRITISADTQAYDKFVVGSTDWNAKDKVNSSVASNLYYAVKHGSETWITGLNRTIEYTVKAGLRLFVTATTSIMSVTSLGVADDAGEAEFCAIEYNNIENVTVGGFVGSVKKEAAYEDDLTANDGYAITGAAVTMGGVDITDSSYTHGAVSDGNVSIDAVTDNVIVDLTVCAEGDAIEFNASVNKYSGFKWFTDGGETAFTSSKAVGYQIASKNIFDTDTVVSIRLTSVARPYSCYAVGSTDWDGESTPDGTQNVFFTEERGKIAWGSIGESIHIVYTVKAGHRLMLACYSDVGDSTQYELSTYKVEVA